LTPTTPLAQNLGPMVTFDIECQVTFGGAVPTEQQVAFKRSVGGHSGWYGPTPIVTWTGSSEALILLVAKSEAVDDATSDALCQQASDQVRVWVADAGLSGDSSADALSVRCLAKPRI